MGLAISSFEAEKITQEQTSTLPPSLPLVIMWAFFRVKKKKNTTACIIKMEEDDQEYIQGFGLKNSEKLDFSFQS